MSKIREEVDGWTALYGEDLTGEEKHRETVRRLKMMAERAEDPMWILGSRSDHAELAREVRARIQLLNREAGL